LIFIEGVRTFYPSVYQSIRENEEVYLGAIFDSWGEKTKEKAKAQATAIIEDSLAKLSERDKKAAKIVIQELFPRTGVSGMFGMGAYEAEFDSDWAKEKRIAAKDYFHRYFTYGIPPHDISDNEIERFINEIPARDVDYVITKINEFAANKRADVLIQKLRSYEDHLSVDVAKPLALVLALGGKVLPHSHPTDNFFGLGIYAQVGMLIRRLVNHIEDMREREEFALDLAERTEPLPFAFEYSSWMRPLKPSRDAQEKVSVISEECKAGIRERIAARIAAEAYEEPLENRYPVDAQNLYRFWVANNQEQVRRYLEVRIREYPESAVRFLIGVLEISPKASDMPLDIPDSSGWYRLIATMVNPEIIMAALKQTYPDIDTIQPAIHNPVTENAERRAAKWFVRLHQQVSSESESDGEAGK